MEDAESTRLSIRMRGAALGHHQVAEREERFSRWRSEQMAMLIWGLGAMAAERVFYKQNSTGVGGDIAGATALAAYMVGASGMGPEPVDRLGRARCEGGGSDPEAVRADRLSDHEPDGRRWRSRPRPDRERPLRPRQARRRSADPRSGLRHRVQPDAATTSRGSSTSPIRSSPAARSTATSCSSSSRRPSSRLRRSICSRRAHGRCCREASRRRARCAAGVTPGGRLRREIRPRPHPGRRRLREPARALRLSRLPVE